MRNWTEHGFSRLTAISDAGSTPAASTSLRPSGYGSACQRQFFVIAMQFWSYAKAVAPERSVGGLSMLLHAWCAGHHRILRLRLRCWLSPAVMKYVYILQSFVGEHYYTGVTDDLDARLSKHNSGEVTHTSKFKPWRIKTYVAFSDEFRAIAFERYLKSGSGRTFAKARL
jgi:putative endonuclease